MVRIGKTYSCTFWTWEAQECRNYSYDINYNDMSSQTITMVPKKYKIGKCNYTVGLPCRPTISATCSEDGTRTRSVMLELFLVAVPLSVVEESICCGRMMEGDDPEPLPASDNDRLLSGSRSAITAKFWISRDSLLPQFSVRTSAGISNSNRIFSSFSSGIS